MRTLCYDAMPGVAIRDRAIGCHRLSSSGRTNCRTVARLFGWLRETIPGKEPPMAAPGTGRGMSP
jgi:hypothetical protein